MTRNRWMKFWPADWRADPALAKCSLAARGLWIDCIALMHDAEPYGHLLIAGEPPTPRDLARILGAPHTNQVVALLGELRAAGVFSERPWPAEPGGDGGGDSRGMVGGTVGGRPDNTPQDTRTVIYSRRMVRDAQASDNARENGRRGGNPTLKGVKGQVKPTLKLEAEAEAEAERIPPDPPSGGQSGGGLFGDLPEQSADGAAQDEPLWDILRLWNEQAHEAAPQVRDLGDKLRRKRIAQFIHRARSLEAARRYFAHIAQQPGLIGERGTFVAFFDWSLRPPVVTRIAEEAGLEFGPEPIEPRTSRQ